MTKPGRTVIALLLDRSSSLKPVRDDVRAGITDLLRTHGDRDGELLVSVVRTGRRFAAPKPAADVRVPRLSGRGTAAVRDALGGLAADLGSALAAMPEDERPARILVLTVRGTADEGSATWGPDELRDLVGTQERDYAWEFVTVTIGDHAGLAPWGAGYRSIGAAPTSDGVRAGLAAASAYLARARDAGPWEPVEGISEAERVAAYPPELHAPQDHTGEVDTMMIPAITAEALAEADAERAATRRWWDLRRLATTSS
ncbi:MAG: hypothetical protein OJJ54_20100 [Pseudonocardia sp.]|nr:hypothetical protein [Pseudonocardia sp.]